LSGPPHSSVLTVAAVYDRWSNSALTERRYRKAIGEKTSSQKEE
jgi:hypothetical protein